MVSQNPDFLHSVLTKLSESGDAGDSNAVDLLHAAIVGAVDDSCQQQLDQLISKIEEEGDKVRKGAGT